MYAKLDVGIKLPVPARSRWAIERHVRRHMVACAFHACRKANSRAIFNPTLFEVRMRTNVVIASFAIAAFKVDGPRHAAKFNKEAQLHDIGRFGTHVEAELKDVLQTFVAGCALLELRRI